MPATVQELRQYATYLGTQEDAMLTKADRVATNEVKVEFVKAASTYALAKATALAALAKIANE